MKVIVAVLAFVVGAQAVAQETGAESKVKVEDLQDKNVVPGDIDTEITNARLRAETGSKSRFSLSSSFVYRGGSVARPLAAIRPQLSGDPTAQAQSSLGFDPEFRYRWSKNDSLTLGEEVGVMTPFQGATTNAQGQHIKQFNVFDPSVAYNRAGKIGPLQSNGALGAAVGTSNESRRADMTVTPSVSYTFLHVFQSGLTLGTSFMTSYAFYSSRPGSNPVTATDSYGHDERNTFTGAIYPFLEYAFNDRYSFRTLFGYFNFVHRYGDPNQFRLLQDYVYQSIGVGIAVTRDIYLYPNVQLSPTANNSLSQDRTNVGLQATVNVF